MTVLSNTAFGQKLAETHSGPQRHPGPGVGAGRPGHLSAGPRCQHSGLHGGAHTNPVLQILLETAFSLISAYFNVPADQQLLRIGVSPLPCTPFPKSPVQPPTPFVAGSCLQVPIVLYYFEIPLTAGEGLSGIKTRQQNKPQ